MTYFDSANTSLDDGVDDTGESRFVCELDDLLIIGRNVRIHSYSHIENSVIMDWVEIGRNCRIRNAIIDKANVIPAGTEIVYDQERDRERYFLSTTGIAVLGRGPRKTTWIMNNS